MSDYEYYAGLKPSLIYLFCHLVATVDLIFFGSWLQTSQIKSLSKYVKTVGVI